MSLQRTAQRYRQELYVVEDNEAEETKEYFKKHNKFIDNAATLYDNGQIDFATFNKVCRAAACMYNTFKTKPSEIINENFITSFRTTTHVPVLDNNILYKWFWIDSKNALIFSLKVAAATAAFLTIASALAAPSAAFFFSSWMAYVLIPSLQFTALLGGAHFLFNACWPRGDISAARSELAESAKQAAAPKL